MSKPGTTLGPSFEAYSWYDPGMATASLLRLAKAIPEHRKEIGRAVCL
jgi:hypothetical protein